MSQAGILNRGVFPPGSVVESLTTDDGHVVTPDASNTINLHGTHGLNTTGTIGPNTATVQIDNAITLGDLAVIPAFTDALTLTTGDITLTIGNINFTVDSHSGGGVINIAGARFMQNGGGGAESAFLGGGAGNFSNGCFASVGIGESALASYTSASHNTAAGYICLAQLNTGNGNSSYGSESLGQLRTGSENAALGHLSGNNYIGAESNNIVISNQGVGGESGVIRIGTNGTQTACFIAGIDAVNVGSVATVVTEASDKLGTAVITGGTGITVTPSANAITIAGSGVSSLTVTSVNNAASPYTVLTTDSFLAVNTSGGVVTIRLPNAPATGRVFYIKDSNGTAAASNITVTTVGGAVNIDGATSFVMNTAYESINVVFDGTAYEVF